MKKTYFKPEMDIVEIEKNVQLLAGSTTVPTGDTPTNPNESDAPEFTW